MRYVIEHQSELPVYRQLADQIEGQIRCGKLRPGDRLPAERYIHEETGIARGTVKRAYEELELRGLIVKQDKRGFRVKTAVPGSGKSGAGQAVRQTVKQLKEAGYSKRELELLFFGAIWDRLPEHEKIRLAWIDCSKEFLEDTAREIESKCGVRVTSFLLDDVRENPGELLNGGFDMAATTINHYDEIHKRMQAHEPEKEIPLGMIVLTVSRASAAGLVKLSAGIRVVIVYDGEWYRYSVERYLSEFAVKGERVYLPLSEAEEYLKRAKDDIAVILPQDLTYKNPLVKDIYQFCVNRGIYCFLFRQKPDKGSLLQLKKRIREEWLKIHI